MSPTFVCSNLPAEVRDQFLAVQEKRFSGISLVFTKDEEELERYFLRQDPYVNRNHPAPHVVIMFVHTAECIQQASSYWKQIPGRKAPVLLMWNSYPAGLMLDPSELPIAGILDLSEHPDPAKMVEETLDFWGAIVKLPMV